MTHTLCKSAGLLPCSPSTSLSLSLSVATSAAWAWRQLAMRKCSIFSNNLQAFNQALDWDWDCSWGLEAMRERCGDAALIDQNPCGRRMLWQPRSIPSFMRSAALSAVRHQAMLKEPNLTNNVDPCSALPPPLPATLSLPRSLSVSVSLSLRLLSLYGVKRSQKRN